MKKIISCCVIVLIIFTTPSIIIAAKNNSDSASEKKEIDIQLSPTDNLFNLDNLKPGDWAPRTIEIKNIGKNDFYYQMKVEKSQGEKLYNELLMEINTSDTELYKGKLKDFNTFTKRFLPKNEIEELDVTILFPFHLGNDFQGTSTNFTFIFIAEEAIDRGEPGEGEDPDEPGEGEDPDEPGEGEDPDEPGEGEDPDEPGEGEDPDKPGEGEDPDEPGEGEDSNDSGAGKNPTDSNDEEDIEWSGSNKQDKETVSGTVGAKLPDTATNMFDVILIGSILLTIGVIFLITNAFRKIRKP